MSRIGKLPIPIPNGVKCALNGAQLSVTGPKGTLAMTIRPEVSVAIEAGEIVISRKGESRADRAYHGMTRALVNNLVTGVSKGYERTLLIEGVGYRAALQGKNLNLQLGFSHPVIVEPPAGITFAMDNQQTIKISGADKQAVGQCAADIRSIRGPEPYKGKGVRYDNETIRRKEGKAGGK